MKKIISLLLSLVIVACALVSTSAYSGDTAYAKSSVGVNQRQYSIDDEFSDNSLLIILTPQESKKNPILTPDDFKGLGVIEVERLSHDGVTNHIYALTLDKHDKQNVLDVIAELQKLEWIYVAEPNYSVSPDNDKPEVTDELLKAINAYEGKSFVKEDVTLKYILWLGEEKYVVIYVLNGASYPGDIVKIQLGEFLLTTPRPVPLIYKDGKLYDIEDAYSKGYLSEFDMYGMVSDKHINVKVIESVYGDADKDGQLSVLDATHIQMYVAGLIAESDINLELSDMDRDGDVSVMDATAVQLKLAGIE